MKENTINKTAIFVTSLLLTASAWGQTPEDAWLMSRNQYGGTARTMAMGNAFTALGGDLGSIAINPAGSAVSGFSQLSVSAGLDISSSRSLSTNSYDGTSVLQNRAAFRLPNISFNLNFHLENSPLKNVNFGFSSNLSDSYTEQSALGGRNGMSSFIGAMAQSATDRRIEAADMEKSDCYDRLPFDLCLNYKAFLISPITGETNRYVGVTEVADGPDEQGLYSIKLREGGMLRQNWGREVTGFKNDYLINAGFNIMDKVFIGANLGFSTISRNVNEYFKEAAVDPSIYTVSFTNASGNTYNTYWKEGRYSYRLTTRGAGVYGKFGILFIPATWLRIGAAIQTPTLLSLTDRYGASASSSFDNAMFSSNEDTGNYEVKYTLLTPMRANIGIAGVIGKRFVVSADYEVCPYGQMVFQHNKINASDWQELNDGIKNSMGTGHSIRIGVEARINNALSARAGYILTSNPSRIGVDGKNGRGINEFINWGKHGENTASAGLGYNSKGSFYLDAAVAARIYPTNFYYPYVDMHDSDMRTVVQAPEYVISRTLWTAVVTLGWRF